MEKKVYVKRYPRGERPREERKDRPRGDERTPRSTHREFHDEVRKKPHFEGRPHRERFFRPGPKQKTKMFTSKDELVNFVNEKGEEGHRIDVYKIEDELYKVVIVERPMFEEEIEKEVK